MERAGWKVRPREPPIWNRFKINYVPGLMLNIDDEVPINNYQDCKISWLNHRTLMRAFALFYYNGTDETENSLRYYLYC